MADKEHLAILKRGVEVWNAWREENPDVQPDLRKAAPGGIDLKGANLEGANLEGAHLTLANLRWAILKGARLLNAILQKADLQEAILEEASLQKADLRGANLQKAILQGAILEEASLEEANLEEAILQKADLQKAILDRTNLERANLEEASLRGASLCRANLKEAKLNKADLWGAHLEHETHIEEAELTEANLQWAILERAHLNKAKLQRANLEETNLKRSHLEKADLQRAVLKKARLCEADLRGAHLEGADLSEADLTNADFDGVHLWRTKLDKINFDEDAHHSMNDGSDKIVFRWQDEYCSWFRLRTISRFPLFGISWTALTASLLTINTIGFLNHHQWLKWINYPIPVPKNMMWILIDCLALVIATTIFKFSCPSRVQRFDETQWVDELGHARLLYIAESMRSFGRRLTTMVLSIFGILLAITLFIQRLAWAGIYILEDLEWILWIDRFLTLLGLV
jgi:uncharacterized protein YjbI with pentapeptide repeats